VNGGLEERLRQDADQAGRSLQQVKLGAQALGAELTDLEGGMGDLDPLGSRIISGAIAAMAFALGFQFAGGFLGGRTGSGWGGNTLAVVSVAWPKRMRLRRAMEMGLWSKAAMIHCSVCSRAAISW
jgi:hypothetical protein